MPRVRLFQPKPTQPLLTALLSSGDSEKNCETRYFSFVLSFYLLVLLTGSPFGYFVVVIVGCTFLDERSHRQRRIFCVHTLLGRISSDLDTRGRNVSPSCLVHLNTFSLVKHSFCCDLTNVYILPFTETWFLLDLNVFLPTGYQRLILELG